MMTSEHKVTCPECRVVNDYEIQKMELIDNDLHVTYMCACGCHFINTYTLVFLGGKTDDYSYDRDGLKISY